MANPVPQPTDDPIAVADAESQDGDAGQGKVFNGMVGRRWIEFFTFLADGVLNGLKVGSADLSEQNASLGATNFAPAGISAGVYRVSYEVEITTAAATSSSVTVGFTWTGNGVAKAYVGTAMTGNTTDTWQSDTFLVYVDGGTSINYATTYASNPASAAEYQFHVVLEAVNT